MCNSNLVYKDYNPKQITLLPPSLDELIAPNHPVRIVNDVIDRINIEPLLSNYKPGGTSIYHPRMLLKVMVYAYLNNIYSSRKMEVAIKENVPFMWLAADNRPDHNTLARFRSERLKDHLKSIFAQIVALLVEEGLVSIKQIYTDGTKIEANANKYSFVWGKRVRNDKARIAHQLEQLWEYTQQVAEEELQQEPAPDFSEIDSKKIAETITKIDRALAGKPVDEKVKKKLSYGKKNWPGKVAEYEQKEAVLGQRNSYSKTDPDATFMRMKDDHLQNGQLKAAYNWQISTSDQYIVNTSIHHNPTDTLTLKPHIDQYEALYQTTPQSVTADAGYGSEENYELLEEKQIEGYVKYNYFDKEQSRKVSEDPFRPENLYYNKEQDKLYCPMGQPMDNIGKVKSKTASGYQQEQTHYRARNCHGCPLRGPCHKSSGNRVIKINHKLQKYRRKARALLHSEQGIVHRRQRPVDVEAVFGNVKQNKGFKRFMLRGHKKVEIETLLIAIAHNLAKKAA